MSSEKLILPLADEARIKAVRDSIIATVPKEADRVEVLSEGADPFPINGWKTFQFTVSYGLFGQTFKKQIVFVQLHPYQELQFVAHAPERYFPATAAALSFILNTWYRESLATGTAAATPKVEAQ